MMLLHTSQGIIRLDDDCLLIFIDETGTEALNDPNHPVFGLGGCAMIASHYERMIKVPWNNMKNNFFNGSNKKLHAADLRASQKQIHALNNFFTGFNFSRFGVSLGDKSILSNKIGVYEITARSLWDRIREISRHYPIKSLAIIFEESPNIDDLVHKYFAEYDLNRGGQLLPKQILVMNKEVKEAGLEVADFVIHTIGRQARNFNKLQKPFALDFENVFRKIDKRATSFLHITQAKFK